MMIDIFRNKSKKGQYIPFRLNTSVFSKMMYEESDQCNNIYQYPKLMLGLDLTFEYYR